MAEPRWPVTVLVALWGSERQSPAGVPPRAGILEVPLDMRLASPKRLGRMLKTLREDKGLTQDELARRLGSRSRISLSLRTACARTPRSRHSSESPRPSACR